MISRAGSGLADLLTELSKRVVEQSGDVHLGKPELAGDTTLAQIGEVVQLDDATLAARERPQAGLDQRALLAELEPALGAGVA